MRFLGSVDDAATVVDALAGSELPAAVAEMGPASRALNRSVLAIPVTGLDPLADAVRDATAAMGKPPERRPFRGHLTLARLRRGSASALGGAAFTARFAVDEVTVVRSDLHPHGARYEVIERDPDDVTDSSHGILERTSVRNYAAVIHDRLVVAPPA